MLSLRLLNHAASVNVGLSCIDRMFGRVSSDVGPGCLMTGSIPLGLRHSLFHCPVETSRNILATFVDI